MLIKIVILDVQEGSAYHASCRSHIMLFVTNIFNCQKFLFLRVSNNLLSKKSKIENKSIGVALVSSCYHKNKYGCGQ
jgi:hypothetical protein